MQYYRKFSLKKYNSFRLNSIAKEIWFPESVEDLKQIFIELKNKKFFILAGGTNVILKPKIDRIICLKQMPKYLQLSTEIGTIVSANYSTTSLISNAIEANVVGIEGLYGIPGKIGGAVIMNSGSGKYAISDYLLSVTTMDYNGNFHTYSKKDLNFKRRYSILQDKQEILLEAIFDFKYGNPDLIELEKTKKHRKSLPKKPSAGGIFVNWHELRPYSDKLIGLNDGDAIVSEKVNIIINQNNATFENIMNLINKIKTIVNKDLQLEIKILGA